MESAREIFNKCCIEIAAGLADTGFHYRPSKHSAIRAIGDLRFEIHFQSSFRNYLVTDGGADSLKKVVSKLMPFGDFATFGNVALIEHASVHSKMLKNFRKSVPNGWTALPSYQQYSGLALSRHLRSSDDAVTGGQIGNLKSPAKWVEFNLANPYT